MEEGTVVGWFAGRDGSVILLLLKVGEIGEEIESNECCQVGVWDRASGWASDDGPVWETTVTDCQC